MPLEYRMPYLGFHGGDNNLWHLVRFAAMLCVTISEHSRSLPHCACIHLHSRRVSSGDSSPLGCFTMSLFGGTPDVSEEDISFNFRARRSRKRAD